MHKERDVSKRWNWSWALLSFMCLARISPSYGGKQCTMLGAKRVKYATASCEGQSASSCWTVVSFDVPEELSRAHAQLSPRAVTLDQLADTMEQSGVGLTVVHSQPPNDEHGDEEQNAGLHYSLDTRLVKLAGRPSVLQVQVLYSDADEENSNPTPGWSGTAESKKMQKGGRSIKLDVMLCADEDTNGGERQGSALLPAPPVLEAPVVPSPHFGRQNSRFHSHPNPFHRHPQKRTPGYPESASVAIGRSRILEGNFEETSGVRQFQDAASSTSKTFLRGGDSSGHRRSLQGPFSSGHEAVSVEVADEVGSCDPFDGGDDWCAEAVSSTELRALDIEGTTMYCSRECQSQEALWCHILDKTNCRMCSNDCDRFCEGQSDCRCHTCPEAGATETWDCSVGDEMACYDQIGLEDFHALANQNQRMTCAGTCLDDGGLWCNAMGIGGCRFCSVSCEEHCASIGEPSGCDCVECPDGLELPSLPSSLLEERASAADEPSCADGVDGDAFCLEQVPETAQLDLAAKGMAVECHAQCLPGEAWPVWCFAEETIGCRYCKDSCDASCGVGVLECDTCYTCGGNIVE